MKSEQEVRELLNELYDTLNQKDRLLMIHERVSSQADVLRWVLDEGERP